MLSAQLARLPARTLAIVFGEYVARQNKKEEQITWKDSLDKEEFYVIEALKELVRVNHWFIYQGKRYSDDTQQGKDFYAQVKNTPGIRIQSDTAALNKLVRLDLFTNDNNSENARIDKLTNPFRRIFFIDQ